jgi:hypothetical protein
LSQPRCGTATRRSDYRVDFCHNRNPDDDDDDAHVNNAHRSGLDRSTSAYLDANNNRDYRLGASLRDNLADFR